MAQLKIKVIMGSIRDKRNGEKVLEWFKKYVSKRKDADYEFLDLKDWDLPMFSEAISPSYTGEKYANKTVQKWSGKIKDGDAYILISPEYNHGYSSVLKNALDHLYTEWNRKPIACVSYGGFVAGSRSVQQLIQVSVELQMVPIRNEVNIPSVWEAFDEKGELKNKELIEAKAKAMLDQLIWFTKVLKHGREEIQ